MRRLTLSEERPDLLLQWSSYNIITPNDVSACSHKKIMWTCAKGHMWTASIKNRVLAKYDTMEEVFDDERAIAYFIWGDFNVEPV